MTENSTAIHISARRDQCAGSGGCVAAAPSLFELDSNGWVHVRDAWPPMTELGNALRAHDACPLGLIEVTDESGDSLA
ncbi:ferredoxin [Mycobacterium sp. NPDC003449]